MSFSSDKIKALYIELKATGQLESLENSKEIILYLLKENNMLAEVLDYAEVLKSNKNNSDVANYYISETLLNTPLKEGQSYVDTLEKFLPNDESSPGQITAKAKALFLDKGPKAAVDFMKEKMAFCQS